MLRSRATKQRISAVETAAKRLAEEMEELRFSAPVTHVYNPLIYAWSLHQAYIRAYAGGPKKVLFLGMNPGPFGMAQTGVPFGDPSHVRDWLGLQGRVGKPQVEHPKRPVVGLHAPRPEVSGTRVWGAVSRHWRTPARFFADHFVTNYCPLLFLEASSRNRTPDKLSVGEKTRLFAACDRHLQAIVQAFTPKLVIAVGVFAESQARAALSGSGIKVARILHPSPANPRANRDWLGIVSKELQALGLCRGRPSGSH